MAIERKINITKPRRSATYQEEAPSGKKHKVSVSKSGVSLTVSGYYAMAISHDDVETVIGLLNEAIIEHSEQVKLEQKEVVA